MATPEKKATVAMLTDQFQRATAAIVTEYRGLTVHQLDALRSSLGPEAKYVVAKNTLAKIAAKSAGVSGVGDLLSGPVAIAFVLGDIAATAKGLRDFAKDNPQFIVKGGVLDDRPIDAGEVHALASLESRDVLLAKLAGAMKTTVAKPARLAKAIPAKVAYAAAALQEQKAA